MLQESLDTTGYVLNIECCILCKSGETETEPILLCLGPLHGKAAGDLVTLEVQGDTKKTGTFEKPNKN